MVWEITTLIRKPEHPQAATMEAHLGRHITMDPQRAIPIPFVRDFLLRMEEEEAVVVVSFKESAIEESAEKGVLVVEDVLGVFHQEVAVEGEGNSVVGAPPTTLPFEKSPLFVQIRSVVPAFEKELQIPFEAMNDLVREVSA